MRRIGMWSGIVAIVGFLVLSTTFATAGLWSGPWDSTSPVYGTQDPLAKGREINSAYHATDTSGNHYFQMNLAGLTDPMGPNLFADTYRIFIDLTPDGDRNSYDYMLLKTATRVYQSGDYTWHISWGTGSILTANNPALPVLSAANLTTLPTPYLWNNSVQQLEWKYSGPIGNNNFEWWAATIGGTGGTTVYDYTNLAVTPSGSPVPIPPTVLLFGSGLAGLVGLGRWRKKR